MATIREVKVDGGMYTNWSDALLAAGAGDTFRGMDSSVYLEALALPALDGLTIDAGEGFTPTIRMGSGSVVSVPDGCTNLTVRDVVIDRTGGAGDGVTIAAGDTSGLLFEDCTILASSTAISGDTYIAGHSVTIRRCTINAVTALSSAVWASVVVRECTVTCSGTFLHANTWSGTISKNTLTIGYMAVQPFGLNQTYNGNVRWNTNLLICSMASSAYPFLPVDDCPTNTYEILGNDFIGDGVYVRTSVPCIWVACDAANLGNVSVQGNIVAHFAVSIYKEFYGQAAVFTGVDYDCHFDCPGDTYPGGYGDKVAHGAHDIYPGEDPLFHAAGDYRLGAGSPCLGTGIDVGETTDLAGVPFAALRPIGCFGAFDLTPPEVVSAVRISASEVRVTFSEAMDTAIADLTTAAAWGLVAAPGTAPGIDTIVVDPGNASVVLTLDGPPPFAAVHTVTAPATLKDAAGNLIDSAHRTAVFTTPWATGRVGIAVAGGDARVRMVEAIEHSPRVTEV